MEAKLISSTSNTADSCEKESKINDKNIIPEKENIIMLGASNSSFSKHQSTDPIEITDSLHSLSHEAESQSHELIDESDKLSSSFCDSESVTSVSQSFGDEVDYKKSKRKKKKKKSKDKQYSQEKEAYIRPNYFVGVQISNPEIHKNVADVQKVILSANEKISSALVDVATLHITLLVAHIANEDELHVACSALDHCGANLSELFSNPPICLKFRGISHFSNQTVFVKVVEDENYARFLSATEMVRSKFDEMGITLPDKRAFNPHLTIAKLSKVPRGREKESIRKIEPYTYASELNKEFGEQMVTGLQFLSMNKPKDHNRYYVIVRESLFDFEPKESKDHSQCCFPRQPVTPKLERRINTSTSNSELVTPKLELDTSTNNFEPVTPKLELTTSTNNSDPMTPKLELNTSTNNSDPVTPKLELNTSTNNSDPVTPKLELNTSTNNSDPVTPKLELNTSTNSLESVTPNMETKLLTKTNSSEVRRTSLPSVPNMRPYSPLALTVVGGIGLLSFAFAFSRWIRRR